MSEGIRRAVFLRPGERGRRPWGTGITWGSFFPGLFATVGWIPKGIDRGLRCDVTCTMVFEACDSVPRRMQRRTSNQRGCFVRTISRVSARKAMERVAGTEETCQPILVCLTPAKHAQRCAKKKTSGQTMECGGQHCVPSFVAKLVCLEPRRKAYAVSCPPQGRVSCGAKKARQRAVCKKDAPVRWKKQCCNRGARSTIPSMATANCTLTHAFINEEVALDNPRRWDVHGSSASLHLDLSHEHASFALALVPCVRCKETKIQRWHGSQRFPLDAGRKGVLIGMEWQEARRERCGKLRRTRAWVVMDGSTFEQDGTLLHRGNHMNFRRPSLHPSDVPFLCRGSAMARLSRSVDGCLFALTHALACTCMHVCLYVVCFFSHPRRRRARPHQGASARGCICSLARPRTNSPPRVVREGCVCSGKGCGCPVGVWTRSRASSRAILRHES